MSLYHWSLTRHIRAFFKNHFNGFVIASAAFFPVLIFTSVLWSAVFQGGNLNAPPFGIDLRTFGFPGNSFMINDVSHFPLEAKALFLLGAAWSGWCIASTLLLLVVGLGGGFDQVKNGVGK